MPLERTRRLLLIVGLCSALGGCRAAGVQERPDIEGARATLRAARKLRVVEDYAPVDVVVASRALARAEDAYRKAPTSPETSDLAAIASLETEAMVARAATLEARVDEMRDTRRLIRALEQQQAGLEAKRDEVARDELARAEFARVETEMKLEDVRDALSRMGEVKSQGGALVLSLPGESLFTGRDVTLKRAASSKLDRVAAALRAAELKIRLEGPAADPASEAREPSEASEASEASEPGVEVQRANAVAAYLASKGLSRGGVRPPEPAEQEPLAAGFSVKVRARDARIEIVVSDVAAGRDAAPKPSVAPSAAR